MIKKTDFKNLEKKLNPNKFIRIHRSYIINVKSLHKVINEEGETTEYYSRTEQFCRLADRDTRNLKTSLVEMKFNSNIQIQFT
ncbi:MAG: LytTR family transcriptional regulator [Ignavibacteriales bacterium]|nr:LytTR family transcriptional regulator [Ignavibacteriales bacterium]